MKHTAEPVELVELKVVGKSGQISLGKRFAGKTLRLERHKEGIVVLTPVAIIPEHVLWTMEEPHRSRIKRGLAWAAATPPQETDIEKMLKRQAKRGQRARSRRG